MDQLGLLLWDLGDLPGAIEAFRRSVDGYEVQGSAPADALTSKANLAAVTMLAGDVHGAIRMETEVLSGRVELLGDLHPDTLRAKQNLAVSLFEAGRIEDAIAIEEQVLRDREEVLVVDTATTATRQ